MISVKLALQSGRDDRNRSSSCSSDEAGEPLAEAWCAWAGCRYPD